MIKHYDVHNYWCHKNVGEMTFNTETKKGTMVIYDLENSSILTRIMAPDGIFDEELFDKWLKKRTIPPERQCIGIYMEAITGKHGMSHNYYTLFFGCNGKHSSDYLEVIERS
ncbi:MAG: hypothetical protein Q4D26_12630 [Clostridia bacterium]|nr:hypothetical protein [Clostridia bacterium]